MVSKTKSKKIIMKSTSESIRKKALCFVGLYYFIIAIISLSIFLYNFIVNLFTSVPIEHTYNYVFQLILFAFLILLIICNYQIVNNKIQKNFILVNIVFSGLQIFSFHFLHIHYFVSFGSVIAVLLGNHYGIQLQMIFQFYNNTATLKIVDPPGFPFISINLISLIIFFIMIVSLSKMKKIE